MREKDKKILFFIALEIELFFKNSIRLTKNLISFFNYFLIQLFLHAIISWQHQDSNPQLLSLLMNTHHVWLNGWVFVYKLSGCGFKSCCCYLNFRYRACFKQGVPSHSGNYRVKIHSEMRMWYENMPSIILCILFCRNQKQ